MARRRYSEVSEARKAKAQVKQHPRGRFGASAREKLSPLLYTLYVRDRQRSVSCLSFFSENCVVVYRWIANLHSLSPATTDCSRSTFTGFSRTFSQYFSMKPFAQLQ